MPKISVVIPTYNCANYLPEAIDSVLEQTFKNFEIIVVDDGSIDNTREILKPYLEKIYYYYQISKGPSAARNLGIKQSSGELVAFLDADDVWLPKKIEKQIYFLGKNKNYGMVYTSHKNFCGNLRNPKILTSNKTCPSGWIFKKLIIETYILLSSVLVKRDALYKIGLFNEDLRLGEDKDLWVRIAYKYRIGVVKDDLVLRRIHLTNLSLCGSMNFNELPLYLQSIKARFNHERGIDQLIRKAHASDLFYRGLQLLRCRKLHLSRLYFWQSIKLNVFSFKTIIFFLISLIPLKIVYDLNKLVQLIKNKKIQKLSNETN